MQKWDVGHATLDSGGSPLATSARCHGALREGDERIDPLGMPNPVAKQGPRAEQPIAPCSSTEGLPDGTNEASGRTEHDAPRVVVDTETRAGEVDALLALATSVQLPGPLQATSSMAPGAAGAFASCHLEPPSTVHITRRPLCPMPATVHRSVETHAMDVRPGPGEVNPSRSTEHEAPASVVLRIVVPGTPDGPSMASPTTAKHVVTDGQERLFGPAVVLESAGVVADHVCPALRDRKKPLPAASH